ncbi:AfsR/SARP family transcriptional regulator [Allosalinactinospora lopnorensis]|uniref:AfsR/SARP family transcriptional regulator n=1 Tax=Allosalinactinospora lopnorensis TaxID=1352348 RepID=UPI000623C0DC|nr:BTAD domain-containing putative transcriptional regulator [Allosalinactinospora lopnorensis]
MAVELGVLGSVEVWWEGHPIDVGHPRQRLVLVALLVDVNRVVSVDQLLDRVWEEDHGASRNRKTLYTYLSRLRRVLPAEGVAITRQAGGYVLTADAEAVDLHRFRHLVSRARAADEDDHAAALFEQAFRLWRGEPFATLDTPWINSLRSGLRRERLAAELDRNDVQLRRGRHTQMLAPLTDLAAEHPLDERLAGQFILALHRCGRTADALEHYRYTRLRLIEELGIEPGPALQQMHQQILTADPNLDPAPAAPAAAVPAAAVPSVVPRQLPTPPALFTGRGQELARLSEALAPRDEEGGTVVIAAVGGIGGTGKTYLALRWAHEHRQWFTDGELYVNLRGFDPSGPPVPPAEALRGFLDALGVEPAAIPREVEAQTGLYRSLVADRQMLIVLDNARETAQVSPLLPGNSGCTVLITSRHQMAGLVTEHAATPLALGMLNQSEARQLLARRLGEARIAQEPEAVAQILQRCAGLPLALTIVAARAAAQPDFPLAVLAAELEERADRLDALDAGDLSADVRAVFSASYQALEPKAALVFALLGLAPGPDISLAAAAALTARTLPATRALLRTLEAAHLIRQHTPGRYQLHDLVRLYAAECAHREQDQAERDAALRRLVDFYLHTADQARRMFDPYQPGRGDNAWTVRLELEEPTEGCTPHRFAGATAARQWFETELPCLLAAHQIACELGWHGLVWRLPGVLLDFSGMRGRLGEDVGMWQAALETAGQLGDPAVQALARLGLGMSSSAAGHFTEGQTHLERAAALFDRTGDAEGQGQAHYRLAKTWERQGDHHRALWHAERALELYRLAGQRLWEAKSLSAVGGCHAQLGDHDQAHRYCEQALALSRAEGDRRGEADALGSLGYIAHHSGQHRHALDYHHQALALSREIGHVWNEAEPLERLGDVHFALGENATAYEFWQQALDLYQTHHRTAEAARVQKHLDSLDAPRQ